MTLAAPDADPGAFDDEPSFPDDAIEVGRVIGPWGLKGWIRVQAYSADPKALFSSRRWFIRPPETPSAALSARRRAAAGPATVWPPLLRITHSKEQGDHVVAAAREIADRAAAEAMKGARIFIARSSFPTAGDGEYYWVDLIGLAVVNREGQALGTVVDLLDTGAHSVLRLRRPEPAVELEGAEAADSAGSAEPAKPAPADPGERLIPFVAAYVDDVDFARRLITVDWGLDY